MKALLLLALASAWNRRLTLGLMAFSIGLSTMLLLGVELIRQDSRHLFSRSVSGIDLVVGPRSSPLQLMLYAVFRIGGATHNMGWESFRWIEGLPQVAWAIPISLGDSHGNFPVIGTNSGYFQHFRLGDDEPLRFAEGRPFTDIFDVVLGAEVAQALGYKLGSKIVLSHGSGSSHLPQHGDKPFTVVGILRRTGSPVDRSLHVRLDGLEAIHIDWVGGAPVPGLRITPEQVTRFSLEPKAITAALIGLKSRGAAFTVQRAINLHEGEALLAALPGVALSELWSITGMIEDSLLAISALVLLVGMAGLVAVILAGLGERRRELAVLRSVGAGPPAVFLLLTLEGLLVVGTGVALGAVCCVGGALLVTPLLGEWIGPGMVQSILPENAPALILGIWAVGILASLLPGYRAYRMSLADGLTPRI